MGFDFCWEPLFCHLFTLALVIFVFSDSSHRDLSASNLPGLIQWICDPVMPEILANLKSATSMKLDKQRREQKLKTKVVDLIELRIFQPVALRDQLSKHTL